jgi:hypothetical protein
MVRIERERSAPRDPARIVGNERQPPRVEKLACNYIDGSDRDPNNLRHVLTSGPTRTTARRDAIVDTHACRTRAREEEQASRVLPATLAKSRKERAPSQPVSECSCSSVFDRVARCHDLVRAHARHSLREARSPVAPKASVANGTEKRELVLWK